MNRAVQTKNKPIHTWLIHFQETYQGNSMGKGSFFSINGAGTKHMREGGTEPAPLSNTTK